ncbi:serine/arginine repetitive matrix protein 1 isoform X2 [Drosophila hydei]|uniref:Serine/arginine repetitive matrix protein 1 isoform X2 n=1 Tax=Drosophila hydei TaxID=7224 RepID=A0A6J1L1P4_DROHY|nr:serine/arginine repetitive matrix protein 1 isoform X2 [Drosophila hydei]
MKGAKSTRTHNERSRKSNKRSEKSAKLDRKSSRGMIYENEELRLRTININAEVERGQSDIKRLRRENEHLRREIWSLRDECDRLNKRFKAKLSEHEYGGCRGSGGSGRRCSGGGRGSAGCDGNSDDSESCDTCRCDDDGHCSDECCQERGGSCVPIKQPLPPEEPQAQPVENNASTKSDNQPMHFDHLSVVSEETLSNPEMLQAQLPEHLTICTPDLNGSQSTLPSLVGPLTPLTPIELVANQLNDLQAMVPPLSYFENILTHHQGPNTVLTPTPELGTNSSTTTGKTMKHTNGWDYNLQSPFSQRKYSNTSSPSRSPPPVPLTTFVPTSTLQAMPKIALNVPTTNGAGGIIETVAITTNATQQALNSPKHFFAPIKPRLKLNTELANRGQDVLPPGSPPPPLQPEAAPPIRDPPDIFVNNALATPYQRPGPRLSPQVSPRHRARSHCQLHHQPCHQHRQRHGQQPPTPQLKLPQQPPHQHCALHRAVVNVAAAVGLGVGGGEANACGGSVVDIYTAALAAAASAAAKSASAPPSPLPLTRCVTPVYATAQKGCHSSCISANALTQPLMTVTTNTTKTTTSPLRQTLKLTASAASCQPIAALSTSSIVDIGSQTDSVNLESLLNDIQTISGDILAIQLEKSKSRDNLIANNNDKERSKPYRSEMNLYLQYDGTNPTASTATTSTATTTVAAGNTSDSNGSHKLSSRTRSLEREHTDSPAPHMPDPMTPFPEKCSYLGFEQLNQAASMPQSPSGQKPPLAVKPSLPAKPPPPLPPARRPPPVTMPTEPPPPPPVGLSPNKSHLYKSLATAAAKRAIFRSAPTQLTRSLDVECTSGEPADTGTANEEEDAAKRKARRVSIVCGEEQPLANGGLETAAGEVPTATASCGDLTSATSGVLMHPNIKAFRQISHSTPSSPHSLRRCINSNTMTAGPAEAVTTASAPPSTTHHHHHRKESSDPVPMTATVSRTKCSRRHSEGTVHSGHRISGSSGGGAGGNGGHHHHHTHHHQHSSLISSNPHHSHHSHQDSNHETVTSQSDRNSNSFGSSRESSTSFSMRSNRRKISISSHTGGKIPWCGCWGNGCL